jgi:predicted RecB family nuclease
VQLRSGTLPVGIGNGMIASMRISHSRSIEPDLFATPYGGVCKLCHWYSYCVDQLTTADDLTLIPFLGRSLRDTMQPTLPTIAALAECNPDGFINDKKTVFPRIGPDGLRLFQKRAVLLKQERPAPYLRAAIQLPVTPIEHFFDIEVDPMRDVCYLHGIVERTGGDNGTERFIYFFADDVSPEAERAAFADAYAFLSAQRGAAIYYYSPYERTHYRKLQEKYPDVCNADDIERLFASPNTVDLYTDIIRKATEWPTRDHSIKTLAKYLGFNWRDTHPSGAASIEWFDRWCREGDPEVKTRILDYNEDDCKATRVLLDGIRELTA